MRKTAFLLTLLIPHLVVANPTLKPNTDKPNTDKQRVAVIELKNDADLKEREVLSLTETARGVVAERLGRKYLVMTRENILSLVDEQTCNDAMAKSCEVEMGRTLGAHFIVSGAVTRLGGVLKVALKVHSTKDSRLLGVREGETQTLEGLAREIKGVAESAVRLIDGSTHKRDDALSRELDALQESSNQLSANLELLKAQEEPQEEVAVDDDFQREIARLEIDAKERKAHKDQVARDFQKVREVALKNPKKGEVAIRLFMKEYEDHPLGNPSAVAAQSLLEEVQARLESEKRAPLLKVHQANVRTAWLQAKPLVEKGGTKGEQALNLFLKAYEDHPLGNPLESEARQTLKVANFNKENKASAEHHKQVKADWDRVSVLVEGDPVLASKAIDLFLDRYKNHPLGNPLESEAREALVVLGAVRDVEIDWVLVPEGSFERGWRGYSRKVTLKAFLMSKTEVTVGQYRACVVAGVCSEPNTEGYENTCTWSSGAGSKENHPINCVDWGQARTFAKWVGADLPTEAEWEYAARGGHNEPFAGSDDPDDVAYSGSDDADEVAWYDQNSGGGTKPVGTKRANGYGLHDMSGNVSELVLDEYQTTSSIDDGHQAVGSIPSCDIKKCDNDAARRVFRGCSWACDAAYLRVAIRDYGSPGIRRDYLGLRLRVTLF